MISGGAFSVSAAAREHPHRLALIAEGRAGTFEGLASEVDAAARSLSAAFVRDGRPLILEGARSSRPLLALYAAMEARVPVVLLHPRWTDGERATALARSGAGRADARGRGILAFLHTSGSTGVPRAIALSEGAFEASARASAANLGWGDGDRWLLAMTPAHVGGLSILTRCLAARRTVVVAPPGRFEASALLDLARDAEALTEGDLDRKLATTTSRIRELIDDGFSPIIFCRYIATAEYIADALREALNGSKKEPVAVESVTGLLPPELRHERVAALGEHDRRVLVATDCLSEGIDLQQSFDAVVHYDLSWNPTRHEQRDGRVDRFGQSALEVRSVLVFGSDNPVDGAVLEVILRKAEQIRRDLGVSVPVPIESDSVLEAILEAVVLRRDDARQLQLDFDQAEQRLDWERLEERERQTRTIFAQATIDPGLVRNELAEAHRALGTHRDVRRFIHDTMLRLGVAFEASGPADLLDAASLPDPIKRGVDLPDEARVAFEDPAPRGSIRISRLHPLVDLTCDFLITEALEAEAGAVAAARSAAIRSSRVSVRTTILLLRLRHQIENVRRGTGRQTLLSEECVVAGYRGAAEAPEWLEDEDALALLDALPEAAVPAGQRLRWIQQAVNDLDALEPAFSTLAAARAETLQAAHQRVRSAGRLGGRSEVTPHLPVDVLGCYVITPMAAG